MTDLTPQQPLTPEDALGRKVAAVIDDLSAAASTEFTNARSTIDRLEQMMLQSSAKTKEVLENHIHLVNQTKAEVGDLRTAVERLSADHARLVNAETV